ncbi:hypothetical protein BKA70DRAFT_734718 [Coprinopsis sp. MPI-PUGE-AT-0042]|nr:hypothetical protein BKA70DRAFT_734718 [Coprinopsis sp. MPI-PUGE-AT-0042]
MTFSSLPDIMTFASWTTMMYDYFLTLDQEVTHVWPLKWSLSLVLFYVNRYSLFIDQHLMVAFYRVMGKPEVCRALSQGNTWSSAIGGNVVYTVIFLQTCAIWHKRRSIVIVASMLLFIKIASSLILIHLHFETWRYGVTPPDNHCWIGSTGPYLRYFSLTVFLTEAGTIGLTLARARYHLEGSREPWVHQLYQNGVYHSLCVLLLSLINAIIPHAAPRYAGSFLRPQRVLESVLCTRLLFVILAQRHRRAEASCGCKCNCQYGRGGDGSGLVSNKTTINEPSAPELANCECDCGDSNCPCCKPSEDGVFTSVFGLETMTWIGGRAPPDAHGDVGQEEVKMCTIREEDDDMEIGTEWECDASGRATGGGRHCLSRATSEGSFYASGSGLRSQRSSMFCDVGVQRSEEYELQTLHQGRRRVEPSPDQVV